MNQITKIIKEREEVVGKIKKEESAYSKRHNPQEMWTDIGFNQALEDVKKLIRECLTLIDSPTILQE